MMRITLAFMLCAVAASAAVPPEVVHEGPVTVTKIREPKKELQMEVQVPGARDSVWQAFTTTAGLDSWMWRDCSVDLRRGGGWLIHFPGGSTGGGTIERFKRGHEITIHAMAPETFPTVRAKGTTAVFQFEAVGDTATRVRLIQTGWQSGEEWEKAYDYLAKGNAQLLGQLRYRFKNGPIDWAAAEKK
jgi:uncharacterized protein YndB with AHSA1/START domain